LVGNDLCKDSEGETSPQNIIVSQLLKASTGPLSQPHEGNQELESSLPATRAPTRSYAWVSGLLHLENHHRIGV
jgi:hypothetical protein